MAAQALAVEPHASQPLPCAGNTDVGTFRLYLLPEKGDQALDVKNANRISAGSRLVCEPVRRPDSAGSKGEVAIVLVAVHAPHIQVLDPKKATARAEWKVAHDASIVALVYGPGGLSIGKVKSLVDKHEELLTELADYADKTQQVEALVASMSAADQTGSNVNAAISGFSKRYGVTMSKLDPKAAGDQQASTLLTALMPSMTTYDPLASKQTVMQQSAGLAASVAGLFFGTPVGLAAGGAALLQNMRTLMFPNTDFRTAFSQANAPSNAVALCAKTQAAKSRTKVAYLWAHRVSNLPKPTVALEGETHLPLGSKSAVKLRAANGSSVGDMRPARDWRLIPASGGAAVPVAAAVTTGGTFEVDLAKSKATPGDYTLAASWDWETFPVPGQVHLHPYSILSKAKIDPDSHDKLLEGSGTVPATFVGPDFEFVEKAAVEKLPRRVPNPSEVPFTLSRGKRGGVQDKIVVELNTAARGEYRLLLAQADGLTHEVPFTVQPPLPNLVPLPIYLNLGEATQTIRLAGVGLERIEAVSTPAGTVNGLTIALKDGLKAGERYPLTMKVRGLEHPVTLPNAIEIAGRRPHIASVRKSLPAGLGITLRDAELPAGIEVGVALTVENLPDRTDAHPALTVGCKGDRARQPMPLTGSGGLYFLTLDPGTVGGPGCRLNAIVSVSPEGASEAFSLGRVVRVPKLEQFTLSDEQVEPGTYAGILKGKDLDTIEKVGWEGTTGLRVTGIPTPVPGELQKQTLRIVLPWPSPAPHAPVYLWLRGEHAARASVVRY
jgi:hypothetical protein